MNLDRDRAFPIWWKEETEEKDCFRCKNQYSCCWKDSQDCDEWEEEE